MIKKILISALSVIGALVIAFVACYFSIPNFKTWVNGKVSDTVLGGDTDNDGDKSDNDNSGEKYVDSADLDFKDGESNGIQLLSAKLPYEAYALYNLDSSKTSYQLTATVLPATAENKEVDWSVEWCDSSITENVYNYITVTPTYDGSCVANVVCEKAFSGEIAVIVTTRQGGCTAEKICVFVGKPSSVNLSSSTASINNGVTALSVGVTYNFDISYSNVYNSVNTDYIGSSFKFDAMGTITLGYYDAGSWKSTRQAEFSEISDSIIEYSLNGSALSVKIKKNPTTYYKSKVGAGSRAAYSDKFYSYDSECYFTFCIYNSKNPSLQYNLKVTIDTTSVSGVEFIGSGVLEF